MKTAWLTISLVLLGSLVATGQDRIHPDLTGDALYAKVVEDYKPDFVELYREAREIIYTKIDNINDTLHTIYTDHTLYVPPNELQPISYVAQDGTPDGINAEHIYPRSKGARPENGNAFSDMHHLYACRWEVNSARSNFAFGEVLDTDTDYWFYKNEKLKTEETSHLSPEMIDDYSEVDDRGNNRGTFEPRESVKGNVARSVFYFYTMYREEAMRADPTFFSSMQETLCEWHEADPIDQSEYNRSQNVAIYQSGKNNPFVLDCTLANRMYCPENPPTCFDLSTSTDDEPFVLEEKFQPAIKVVPNPNNGIFKLDISNIKPKNYRLEIFAPSGRLMYSITERLDYFNTIRLWNAKTGLYFVHMTDLDTGKRYSDVFKIVK